MKEGVTFYRCTLCHRPVSPWDIRKFHGCGACGNNRLSPANLTAWEKFVQVVRHPAFWKWRDYAL